MRRADDSTSIKQDLFFSPLFPTALVDQKIKHDVQTLRQSRFFFGYDHVRSSLMLARKLIKGELSGGSDDLRGWALAWCSRLLSSASEMEKAEEFLNLAMRLGNGSGIEIASAFIASQKGDKKAALNVLIDIESPLSRSAALMIVAQHEREEGAVAWLKAVGFGAGDLDADGKYVLLRLLLEISHWDEARKVVDAVSDQDFVQTPILHYMIAMTRLLGTVPEEFRSLVRNQLPLIAANFPLASDSHSLAAQRKAYEHFMDAAKVARRLNCAEAAKVADEYALWIELKVPATATHGRERLKSSLRDPKSALHLVPLGVQFGIKLDLEAVEKEIDRQIALHGGITLDTAKARFALCFRQKNPKAAANYIDQHYDELSKYINAKSLLVFRIETHLNAGQIETATDCLELLLEHGLSPTDERRIRTRIREAEGTNPIETLKELFKNTNLLSDLEALVEKLESAQDWDGLCKYGEILFKRTSYVGDAERFANALDKARQTEQLVTFLKSNIGLLKRSKCLKLLYAWALYYEGALLQARSELTKLDEYWEDPSYRTLQVHLGVALGDMNILSKYVAREFEQRSTRSAQDLMGTAQLAFQLDSPLAKELLFAAASKSSKDAELLCAAYTLAMSAGWDDNPAVSQWIQRANVLSEDNGPIQRVTLKDFFDRKIEWDRRESETWQLLSCGDVPMFVAAQSLNKALVYLMLFPAYSNLSERDPRGRVPLSAYSGKRQLVSWNSSKSIGIDLTALFTLSFLGLLDKVFEAFERVYVPHSTMAWLFEEKQKTKFHQPSRIRDANLLRDLLANELLEKFVSTTVADGDLSAQVGDELAMFIAEAEIDADDDIQRIVVCPSPVHRLSSLMEEEADLTAHSAVLFSCQSIVAKLREKGQLTIEEAKKALAFLQLQEKPWPTEPGINDGAILYLSDLAVTYFLHLGIFEKLKAAGFRPFVSPRSLSEADQLITYENTSGRVIDALERIRSGLASRIESGKVKVGKQRYTDKLAEKSMPEHPCLGILALVGDCDAIISDDRFINQHAYIDNDGSQVPMHSTLDLLVALTSARAITAENQLEYRTQLRRAGYFLVPVGEVELVSYLSASQIQDGRVIETAELKAIRESLLRVRMSDWLQIPKEAPWLVTTLQVFIRSLQTIWMADDDLSSVTARSDWLVDQLDIRGWVQSLDPENGINIVKSGRSVHILMMLILQFNAPKEVRDAYWNWVQDRVLIPVKEQFPDLYALIVAQYKRQVAVAVDQLLDNGETT